MSDFISIGLSNTLSLIEPYEDHFNFEEFLHDPEVKVPLFCTQYDCDEGLLDTTYDIDGLLIELNCLAAIRDRITYLSLPPIHMSSLKDHYHILKKHMVTPACSPNDHQALKHSVGHCLAQTSSGYFVNLSVVPRYNSSLTFLAFNKTHSLAVPFLNRVRAAFTEELRNLHPTHMRRDSIQKNSLSNPSRFNILAQDQQLVLGLLDRAINREHMPTEFSVVMSMSMFGQKSTQPVDLDSLVEGSGIKSVSVHSACTLVPTRNNLGQQMHILWSRVGLEEVVGTRGSLYPALSMSQAANFQSNLDRRQMDVCRPLLNVVCNGQEQRGSLNFLQLYTDSPHTHMSRMYKHPVSGTIATCDLLHHNTNAALHACAKEYIEHMCDLEEKMVKPLTCRIEQVRLFSEGGFPAVIRPETMFNQQSLWHILSTKPMILPFVDREDGMSLLAVVQEVMLYLNNVIRSLYGSKPGYHSSWKTYQAELGLEELLYGHPLSPEDRDLSVSLGTSASDMKSVTCMRGFIGLAPHTSATSEVGPPPIKNWTRDVTQTLRIERVFALCDTLGATASVVGVKLWLVFLGDVYWKTRVPLASLKAEECAERVSGATLSEKFIQKILGPERLPFPCTFAKCTTLVRKCGLDPVQCLQLGLEELKLRWVPDVRFWVGRHEKLYWDRKSYVELCYKGGIPTKASRMAVIKTGILDDMERRGLCYGSKLARFREQELPWLEKCLVRIPENVKGDRLLRALTFLSCIGMIENNLFVEDGALQALIREIPLTQKTMQDLQLQSRFSLPRRSGFLVWRLHEDIPSRLPLSLTTKQPPSKKRRNEDETEQQPPEEALQEVNPDEVTSCGIKKTRLRFLPASKTVTWSSKELSLIDLNPDMTYKAAYQLYISTCEVEHVPARPFHGFSRKRRAHWSSCSVTWVISSTCLINVKFPKRAGEAKIVLISVLCLFLLCCINDYNDCFLCSCQHGCS